MTTEDMTSQEATDNFVSSLEDAGWTSTAETTSVGAYSGTYLEKGDQGAVVWSTTTSQGTITIVATGPKSEVSGETGGETDGETDGETGESGYSGTGTSTYSGTWSGEGPQAEYEGTWEFTVDWETGDVTGLFKGDASGDISGSVSNGEITAEGQAGFGMISWSGSFAADGSEISGTWEDTQLGVYSGTWSGQEGELEEDTNGGDSEGEGLPSEDQASGVEPIDRYPGSVILSHTTVTYQGDNYLMIEYGTEDSISEVADWYKGELGDPITESTEDGEKQLMWTSFENYEMTGYTILFISSNGYTTIEIQMRNPEKEEETGGEETIEEGTGVNIDFTPTQLSVGDTFDLQVSVTNEEYTEMTIYEATIRMYWNGELLEEDTTSSPEESFLAVNIPSGETVKIMSSTQTFEGDQGTGNGRIELSLEVSYGPYFATLEDSAEFTVTE